MESPVFSLISKYPECVLDRDRRFTFFCHNKVAQTSINRLLLRRRVIVKKDNRVRHELLRRKFEREFERARPVCFTIVRNPYSRLVSAFEYLKKCGRISSSTTFDQFVGSTLTKYGTDFDPHLRPQQKWPLRVRDIGFDYVGYHESIEEDWRRIAPAIGAEVNLPKSNESDKKARWQDYYTETTAAIVADLYLKDFEEFGYSKVIDEL